MNYSPNPAAEQSIPPQPGKQERWCFLFAVVAVFLITVGFHLWAARKGWSDYRDQHIGTALQYAKGEIDLLRPIIVGFNANNNPTLLEFPLWQAVVAILFKCFGFWLGWANVAALLFAAAALWPLYQIAKNNGGKRVGWWTLLFFVTQPQIFLQSGRGSADGSCLTLTIWFVYFAELLIRSGQWRWFFPATVFAVLTAVTKAPFFFCGGLACFFLLVVTARRFVVRWFMLAAVGLIAVVVFKGWTHYTHAVIAKAEFPLVDLRTGAGEDDGASMRDWYFGSMQYRLNPTNWIKGGWRVLNAQFGSFALVGLFVWGFFRAKNRIGQAWSLAGLITTLVFTHLVLHHWHYYLMVGPPVALLCGVAAARMASMLGDAARNSGLIIGGATVLLLLATVQGLNGMWLVVDADPYPGRMTTVIQAQTSPADKILIQGGGWGGELLIRSDRKGLSIWDTKFLEKPENLRRIQELGFTKLVMVSESPMMLALQQINPSRSQRQRETYEVHLTDVARPWKTILQTDDILVKEIPRPTGL